MSVQPKPRMSVDAFLAWAETQEGRHELVDGKVVAMAAGCVRSVETKASVFDALRAAIRTAELSCRVLLDGVAVRIDAGTSAGPDVLVYCGERLDPDATEVPVPIIVVEVVSPSTRSVDVYRKLEGYFRIPSILHYLIVEPRRHMVIHHSRGVGDAIETRVVSTGRLEMSPPGLSVPVATFFEED